jgi:soluble lytic murein transglycosylase-like protein
VDGLVIARNRRRACRPLAFGIAAAALLALLAPATARAAGDPLAAAALPSSPSPACAPHAAEAAARSALPANVILRVMHVESRGRANAISPKGAMGCMQIMPATWRYLTARHALGSDPWNARLNMIGGALYLAELARQFGFPGAYAAYNAGPARYARHVRGGGRLPAETVAYMASLSGTAPPRSRDSEARDARTAPPRWQEAQLFLDAAPQRAPASEALLQSPGHALFPLARPARDEEDGGRAGEK